VQGKIETGGGSELPGKDSTASEKEGAAGEAVDILATGRGVAEAVGMEKVEPGGWGGGGKELMDDMGAAGGSTADWGTDR